MDAYGARTALESVAQVSVRDGRTLSVSVFDSAGTQAVERAIRSAGLNLNPVVEGAGRLRVPVPRPSRETRDAMRKTALKEAENARIATRHVRRKAMDEIKGMKDEVAADEIKRMEKSVKAMTDRYVGMIDELLSKKVKAIDDV